MEATVAVVLLLIVWEVDGDTVDVAEAETDPDNDAVAVTLGDPVIVTLWLTLPVALCR